MSKEVETKEALERNKEIRSRQNEELKEILRNSTSDKEMRKTKKLETEVITRTSRDDARDRRKRFWILAGVVFLILAALGSVIYLIVR